MDQQNVEGAIRGRLSPRPLVVSEEEPVCVQYLGSGQFAVAIHLPSGIGLERFQRLARHPDRAQLLAEAIDRWAET